jgi:hypothetical protein
MKCPTCNGLGYPVDMCSAIVGKPIDPLPIWEPCQGTGRIPDPRPAPFISRLTAARKKRRG